MFFPLKYEYLILIFPTCCATPCYKQICSQCKFDALPRIPLAGGGIASAPQLWEA